MTRLTVFLLACLIATPALAINDDPTETMSGSTSGSTDVLRSTPPPTDQAPPVAQAPTAQPAAVRAPAPVYTPPPVYYYVPVRPVVMFHHHHFRH